MPPTLPRTCSHEATAADHRPPSPHREILISLLLVLVTLSVYWPVRHYEFINYDDPIYVSGNDFVLHGLSREGIVRAFSQLTGERTYWHPVTWLSHMLDCQLFGTNAGAHHLVNVCFHAANAVLLFLVLIRMTGAGWRSAVVAALFAWHPLQVDSVAWVAERKNVLSTCLALLTILAYVRYVRRPSVGRYGLVAAGFALGLMAKPMLVTLPLILLLLDFWPLQRFQGLTLAAQASIGFRLVGEKLPLLALSVISSVITIVGHAQLKALSAADELPIGLRLANALISYARYVGKMIWPVNLAVFYPYPDAWPPWAAIGAGLWLVGSTTVVIWLARRRPYLAAGWFWYVITLVPVIGLVQAGSQSMADRFTYVPLIGLFVMLVGLVADLKSGWPQPVAAKAILTVAALSACLVATHRQLRYWRDSESLWTHALLCNSENYTAHKGLGAALVEQGRMTEAIPHFNQVLEHDPKDADAHNNLGYIFITTGRINEAMAHLGRAITINPNYADARYNLGLALSQMGRMDEAMALWQEAIKLEPNHAKAHNNLGIALFNLGSMDQGIAHLQRAVALHPNQADDHNNLAVAFFKMGRMDQAIAHWQRAVEINPRFLAARNSLAWALATCPVASLRDGVRAIALAEQSDRLAGGRNPELLATLAAACAEAGRFSDAVAAARRALQLATAQSNPALSDKLRHELELYESGLPCRDDGQTPVPVGRGS
jgi:protein O-mannosyl-transferase